MLNSSQSVESDQSLYLNENYSFKNILSISIKDYLKYLPRIWKLWLLILLPFIFIFIIASWLHLPILIIFYLIISIFFINPFIFIYILQIFDQNESEIWNNFIKLTLSLIKNPSLLSQYSTLASRSIRIDINIKLLTLITQITPGNDPLLEKSESIEKYYPYFLRYLVPYLIRDNKDPKKIYSLANILSPEDKKRANQYIMDEVLFCFFLGILFFLVFFLLIYLSGGNISKLTFSIVKYFNVTFHNNNLIIWIILLPLYFINSFISQISFIYQYNAYKFVWKKYF